MPELSDVEGFRRYFARQAGGRRIERVEAPDADLLRNTSAQRLGRALKGERFADPRRHGKWLLPPTRGPIVLLHFGMTGRLSWSGEDPDPHSHDRVIFPLAGGALRFRDQRKFGGVWLARDEGERTEVTGPLGPDALAVERTDLDGRLAGRRGAIKSALMDQELVAGLGNLLSDEILWQARVHPRRKARGLEEPERAAIYDALRQVLRESVEHGRVPRREGWITGARDDRGAACPRCGTKLCHSTVASRSACWCPRCQPW
jgi:formamidopyrimidine-DNA glycosylase